MPHANRLRRPRRAEQEAASAAALAAHTGLRRVASIFPSALRGYGILAPSSEGAGGLVMGVIRHFAVACLTSLAALFGPHTAGAQTYPDRPIRMVVPYTPGGQFDIHARLLAEKMS